jgi:hypothetical protein
MAPIQFKDQQAVEKTGRIIWGIIALLLIAVGGGSAMAGLSLDLRSVLKAAFVIALCLAISFYYRRWRSDPWISIGAEASAQLALIMMLGMLLAYPLAALAFPFRDAEFNAIDRWMGFDWLALLRFVNTHPLIGLVGKAAYWTMGAQALFVIAALVASSNFLRLHQYIIAVAISLLVTLTVFTFVPAGGAYSYLHVAPEDYVNIGPTVTFGPLRHLLAIRSGNGFVVTADDLEGLVAFPSFHTVCGLMYIWALFPLRRLRWWVTGLNAVLIAAAPVEGAHYFIDLIAGGLVAWASIAVTRVATEGRRLRVTLPLSPGAVRSN